MPHFESEYEEKLYNDRLVSLEAIGALGEKAGLTALAARYPNGFAFTHTIPQVRALGETQQAEQLEAAPVEATVAGRLIAIRAQGKAGFAQLQQGGERLQIYVRKDDVGEDAFALYKLLHVGDHVGVRGHLMRTRTGELTLKVATLTFLSKAMLALPDKYHGLEDVELRYRQRYVDLIVNSVAASTADPSASLRDDSKKAVAAGDAAVPGVEGKQILRVAQDDSVERAGEADVLNVREVFVKRAAVLRAIRKFFDARGYLEVETPMLHTVAGGAAARPFTTHHNALDMPLSLRIAPELYLKRLVVGGMDRVYEINRNFRNEGVSTRHNPEFTMLEFYQAYANYHDLMDLTEELVKFVAMEVNGTTVTRFGGEEIDLGKWQKLSMREAIVEFWEADYCRAPGAEDLTATTLLPFLFVSEQEAHRNLSLLVSLKDLGGPKELTANESDAQITNLLIYRGQLQHWIRDMEAGQNCGKIIADMFEFLAEANLIQPTIIYDFPLAVSPLSKVKPDDPDWVERFEFYIGGFEVGNAFSELNDAADQERRFEAQVADKDPESMAEVDEDYIRALRIGLPPTAGEGIGIDRLTMLLTGSRSIRDVILFPLMRSVRREDVAVEAVP